MALDLSKLNFFSRLDARARVFVLFAGVIGVVFLVYLGTKLLSSSSKTTGPSHVANAPAGLQSVPGGKLNPEYYRALQQANAQSAQQAQISGGSAMPTLMNTGEMPGTGNCNIICSDQSVNVKNDLDAWVKQGKISPDVANELQALADKNVSVDDYAAELDKLVKEGKLTPEQARELLEAYKKQHANKLLQDSANVMDGMIKSGQLPLDAANQLLAAQKANMSPSDYAALLQQLVRDGKISPELAQQLLAQYTQQRAREIVMKSIASLHQLTASGQLSPDIEKDLIDLENRMVPVDLYAATLQKYITAGKIIPAVAGKILDEFKSQKASIGPSGTITQLLEKAEAAAYGEINDLMKAGKMTPEIGAQLTSMIKNDVPFADYQATINQLVKQGKMTPEIAKLKIGDYQAVKNLREMAKKLAELQGNNASVADYASALKDAVQSGVITPEQAGELLKEYQVATQAAAGQGIQPVTGAQNAAFAALQQQLAQAPPTAAPTTAATTEQFAAAESQAALQASQEDQARIQALMGAMSGQAAQLIASWQPPVMEVKAGEASSGSKSGSAASGAAAGSSSGKSASESSSSSGGAPLIKAGTVIFAVLDTAANSDYPDSPVMATVVEGKYKGAKLMGKLATAKGVSGQLDRISLNFTLMNLEDWPKSKSVTAYGIDPDTAHTVLASHVDYHYLQRFGAIMATSFLTGYASAITQAGTSTTGIFGTSTTHNTLSPSQKMAVALGQIGTTLGQTTQNYVNIPPTVKVDSGVSLGILFMSDVS